MRKTMFRNVSLATRSVCSTTIAARRTSSKEGTLGSSSKTHRENPAANSPSSLNMRSPVKHLCLVLLAALVLTAAAYAQTHAPLPTTQDVVAKMMEFDAQRSSELTGYTAVRRYVAANGSKHHAEMVVAVACASDGSERFSVLSEAGSGWVRHHIFPRLLKEEAEASRRGTRNSTRITPANYKFTIAGEQTLSTGPAYVLTVAPKTNNKYLIDGRIWVDANDYSIVRIEAQPARNPSFWVHSVRIVRTYQKVGPFWFASSTDTTSRVRILGPAELTIENFDYALAVSNSRTVRVSETIR